MQDISSNARRPEAPTSDGVRAHKHRRPGWHILEACFNWAVWAFMALMVSSQFLAIGWDSTSFDQELMYGRPPTGSLFAIAGTNDEPYTDRNLVCMAQGRSYVPMQLSTVLNDPKLAITVDTTGTSINGYRVVKRESFTLDKDVFMHFIKVCERIDYTLETIQQSCETLGYNVTRDMLRVVEDIHTDLTKEIPRALPILIMPFWDNAAYAHYAIPGRDGMACVFRLDGMYMILDEASGVFRATPRSVREEKTVEWLGKPGGVWRNGWYEDASGHRWSSDMMTSDPGNEYGLKTRHFDMSTGTELECEGARAPRECRDFPVVNQWGSQSSTSDTVLHFNQVYISNGTHYGQFMFEGVMRRVVTSSYTLEIFISNISIFVLLFRWLVSMLAMARSYHLGVASWQTTGVGCLSSCRTFNILPIILLPRLKMIMAAIWTVGCEFEGQQRALSEAWFAVYPAIVEFVLYCFSILNALGKVTHRRTTDALFGPTMIAFAVLHRIRQPLARSGLIPFDSRIPTSITSNELSSLKVIELFSKDIALRMNGTIAGLLYVKVILLAINVLPLLFSENMTRSGKKYRAFTVCEIEKTLALRASNIGGMGRSEVYAYDNKASKSIARPPLLLKEHWSSSLVAPTVHELTHQSSFTPVESFKRRSESEKRTRAKSVEDVSGAGSTKAVAHRHVLIEYEINRLGYLVFGGRYLLTYDDWYILTSLAPLRVVEKLWNHRISVFDVTKTIDGYHVGATARLCRLDDERLRSIPFYEITLCGFK